jgi:hypothetical protein
MATLTSFLILSLCFWSFVELSRVGRDLVARKWVKHDIANSRTLGLSLEGYHVTYQARKVPARSWRHVGNVQDKVRKENDGGRYRL